MSKGVTSSEVYDGDIPKTRIFETNVTNFKKIYYLIPDC